MQRDSSAIDALLSLIEGRYGAYGDDEREEVAAYLPRRVDLARENLARVLDAIREECPIRFGAPDVATIKQAIQTYETEYALSLRAAPPLSARDYRPIEAPTPEDDAELRRMAETAGIDTSREGWMQRYLFRRLGELSKEKKLHDGYQCPV
jgi:hypothetical protein